MSRGAEGERAKLVTAKELAVLLDVNRRTIAKFIDDGMPVEQRGKGGRPSLFDPDVCVAWKRARDHVAATPQTGTLDLLQEKARLAHFQAELAQQLLAVRAGRLLTAADVEKAWAAEIGAARALILSSYTTAADRVFRAAVTDGLAGVERELKTLAYGILRELASGATKPGEAA